MSHQDLPRISILLVGDDRVGKTTLNLACNEMELGTRRTSLITRNEINPGPLGDLYHTSTRWSYGSNIKTVPPDGQICNLSIIDTACSQYYDSVRLLAYPVTDVFLVCFSTVVPESLKNVSKKWVPEIQQHCPGTPFLLVGTRRGQKRKVWNFKKPNVFSHCYICPYHKNISVWPFEQGKSKL